MLRSSLARLAKQVPGLKLPKSGTTTRRKKRSAQTGPAEAVESRMMLSAVSFDAGTLTFDAAADVLDEVDVSAPDANSLVIEVGGGDTIQLNGAAAGNANFVLSNGDTVLTVNVAAGGVAEAEFNLGNEFDTLTVAGLPSNLTFAADGGEGDDVIDASGATSSVVLVGGTGNDILTGGSGNDALFGGSGDDELRGGDGEDNLVGGGQIEVTVTNLQQVDGALLTPFFLATQDGVYDFFDVGSASSGSLERLAEDGNTGPRIVAALNSGGANEAVATPGGPLLPGESRTVSLLADSLNELTQYLSYASMVIPSNDAFVGNDDPMELDLFDANGDLIRRTGANAHLITGDDVYDAGTEDNDEIPANTAALAQAAPNTGVTEGGVIRQHEGFQGSARFGGSAGNILNARPNADFTLPNVQIASIEVDSDDGNDLLIGGSGNDVLTGGDGDDTLIGGFGDDELNGGNGNDELIGGGQIEVTITNLQQADGALLTPFFLATQDGVYDFFDVGGAASGSLERLAEDGITANRIQAAIASGGVNEAVATPGGPLQSGDTRTVTFYADSNNDLTRYLSYASMVIPSNDAFIGNDSPLELDLFDAAGNLIQRVGDGAVIITGDDVYDAGTEVNDEVPANTAALAQAAPNTGVTEGGVIRQHEGFQGSNRFGGTIGNVLTARPNADFTVTGAQIASIQVGTTLDGDDVLNGGDGDDLLYGNEGNDSLFGGAGEDFASGGIGDDTLHGDDGDDEVDGGDGNDKVIGGSGDDILLGGDGEDTVIGGFGDDALDGGDGNDKLIGGGQIEVTVTNLQQTNGALLTPFFLATQDGVYDFFDIGSSASGSLERLAEDGITANRIEAAIASGGVNEAVATPGGPLQPGDTRTVTFYADSTNGLTRYLSYASMVIPSNDAFIGNDSPLELDLFDAAGNLIQRVGDGAVIITGDDVYDAGTEVNDEVPANTAALAQAAPDTGVTEGGVIRQHEGFQGSNRFGGATGNVLTARPNADFTAAGAQIASIQVGTTLDGDDVLNGGAGDDVLLGNEGDDVLEGGPGADDLQGGIGADDLFGDEGDDTLAGGGGDDNFDGGDGVDATTVDFGDAGVFLDVFGAEDELQVVERITGTRQSIGGFEDIVLQTGNEGDTFRVRSLADAGLQRLTINAGDGNNFINAWRANVALDVTTGSGNDVVWTGIGNDIIATGDGRDIVYSGIGDDEIDGGDGGERIFAGSGNDVVTTGSGNDLVHGNSGDDTIDAGDGNNRVVAGNGDDTVTTGSGRDRVFGGSGNDVIDAGDGNDVVNGNGGDDAISGGDGNDNLSGAAGDDLIRGGNGNDRINGNSGNDILLGNAGSDRLSGSSGRDLLFGGSGRDNLFGGSGEDVLHASETLLTDAELGLIRDEWTSARSNSVRVANITDGSGSADRVNGSAFISAATSQTDNDRDRLFGQSSLDAFFASLNDRTFRRRNESLFEI